MNIKNITSWLLVLGLTACGSTTKQTASAVKATPLQTRMQVLLPRLQNNNEVLKGRQVEKNVEALLSELTLEEKIRLVHAGGSFHVAGVERLGIHEMWMTDGPHGVRHEMARDSFDNQHQASDHSTYLPPLTMVAASWNPDMAALHGQVLGAEARHRHKDIVLGPGVNLARLPLNGRNFEYMGEDPYLASKLAVEEIKAIQNNDVAATIKHYALNTQELNRTGVNAMPDERTLREIYLPIFEAAVKEGEVKAVMGAYNNFRGTNSNQSKHLIDILKKEWGFDGVLLTDWNVNINTFDAAMNGLDLEMGTNAANYDDYFFAKPLLKMIKSGKIPESVLDEKVRRILGLQLSIGMMDNRRQAGQRNIQAHRDSAYQIASEGVVLLKNEQQLLPLNKNKIKNLLVLGPNADKKHSWGGGSSQVKALYEITPLQGLKEKLGDTVNVQYMQIRGNGVTPIEGDYVSSRHWTGTPSWQLKHYQTPERLIELSEDNVPDSAYHSKAKQKNLIASYITMKGLIKPLESGEHLLNVDVEGTFKLFVDETLVMDVSSQYSQIFTQAIALDKDKEYAFEIHYDGDGKYTLGWDAPGMNYIPEAEYLQAARNADAVLYFGGLSHNEDRESIDRSSMKMPNSQDALIKKLARQNANTVVFIVAGSPIEMPWLAHVNSLVWGWYGGMDAGRAYADILFGDLNPSGKLPITLPRSLNDTAPIVLDDYNALGALYPEGVYVGYRWFDKQKISPLFSFGHGLSYSQFSYEDIKLTAKGLSGTEKLKVTATITNTSKRDGAEVVQLYLRDFESSVDRPNKELKGFKKVFLKAGESKIIDLVLHKRDLSYWDVNTNDWKAEPGYFEIMLGSAINDIRLTKRFLYRIKEEKQLSDPFQQGVVSKESKDTDKKNKKKKRLSRKEKRALKKKKSKEKNNT